MLDRIFPATLDNRFRGHRLGLWLLYPILFVKIGISLAAIFTPDGGAQRADGIPLDSFPPAASEAVIGVVAFLGLATLITELIGVLALIRYRAMAPLIYVLMVTEDLGHRAVGLMKPIAREGAPMGGFVNLALIALIAIGLILSLVGRETLKSPAPAQV